jgi:hypothetical protein
MEIKIEKPTKYADSMIFLKETGFNYFMRDSQYFLSGDATEKELLDAFAAHNPALPTEPTVIEKLASVGLSVADLKVALGL